MKNGMIDKIYPLTKLLVVTLMIIVSIFMPWWFGYCIILTMCIILSILSGKFKSYIKKIFTILIIFLVFIFLFKVLLDKSNTKILFTVLGKNITTGAILATLVQTKVLVVIVSGFVLFFEITELEDIMIAMQQSNIPSIAGYVFLSSLQMISDMTEKSKVIMNSQKARGIETEGNFFQRAGAFFPSIGPLIISSITDLEEKAITLEVRGFSYDCKKTSLKDIKINKLDKILMLSTIIISIILITGRVILWLM
ncbi:energy-coupling factor transporter transmembrane component T family protein [Oceanivirga salmonicida]|uniref:energy-coupling factor transporter transmembrane component T family protein n=1 Tax=Oceanivirga salmonicida TaxID=1769291 RepID=UPI0018CC2D43|nr:energy-coupling factor transporter transmembrane component T [Oceanivirga salmonicida]